MHSLALFVKVDVSDIASVEGQVLLPHSVRIECLVHPVASSSVCHTDSTALRRWFGTLSRLVSVAILLPVDRSSRLEASSGHRRLMYTLRCVGLVHEIYLNHFSGQQVTVLHGGPATHLLLFHFLLRQSLFKELSDSFLFDTDGFIAS